MADVYNYVTATGTITPDATEIQTDVENDFKVAFGEDLIVTPETPQGELIVAETLARRSVVQNNIAVANQFNPELAGGIFLDAIGALTNAIRKTITPTIISGVSLGGIAGTILNAGTTQAQVVVNGVPVINSTFSLRQTVTLDSSGKGVGDFEAIDNGNLVPQPGTLTGIISVIPGWETVNNSGTVITGVTLTGAAGTIIPAGQKASIGANGAVFRTISSVTIPATPATTVLADFVANDYGATTVAVGTLNTLINPVAGLMGVNNSLSAIVTVGSSTISPGTPAQSDAQFRNYRRAVLGVQGSQLAQAVLAAVRTVQGVSDAQMRENTANTVATKDGVVMQPHSIYVVVDGGTSIDVATAITAKKGGGCAYTNNAGGTPVTQPVVNPYSGQTIDVLFDRAIHIPVFVKVTVKADTSVQDPVTAVQTAINNYATGLLSGEAGLVIGQNVSVFELAGAINRQAPGLYVQSITTATSASGSFTANEIVIPLWERATIDPSSISVTTL